MIFMGTLAGKCEDDGDARGSCMTAVEPRSRSTKARESKGWIGPMLGTWKMRRLEAARGRSHQVQAVVDRRSALTAEGRLPAFPPYADFTALIESECYYCGSPPSNLHRQRSILAPGRAYKYGGVDRIDNDKGYEIENCVPCCRACNISKGSRSQREFLDHARAISLRHPK